MKMLNKHIINIRESMHLDRSKFTSLLLDSIYSLEEEKRREELLTLKIFNLLLAQYEFRHGFQKLLSRPFFIDLDPANACQLHCPGCIHSPTVAPKADWNRAVMDYKIFKDFMKHYGPYSFGMYFYNYGEPFINRNIYQMIKYARGFGVSIAISSNLSLPVDAHALVESGLDTLICSIDGATQETYEIYRRGGNLKKIEENIRAISAEKLRTEKSAPNIVWQFLTFEHNIHELDMARKLANEWGANQFIIGSPFSVQSDDPTIKELSVPEAGWHSFPTFDWNGFVKNGASTWDHLNLSEIEHEYKAFKQRLARFDPNKFKQSTFTKYCDWPYKALVFDGSGRILPCCSMPLISDNGKWEMGVWGEHLDIEASYNTPEFQDLRMNQYRLGACEHCGGKEYLIFDTEHIKRDLQWWPVYQVLNDESIEALCNWKSML